jgi:hypothetical protein
MWVSDAIIFSRLQILAVVYFAIIIIVIIIKKISIDKREK